MTPKEKAKELVDKFMQPVDGLHKYPMCFDTAKQCALIAVEEVINSMTVATSVYLPFWQQVKQEIEAL